MTREEIQDDLKTRDLDWLESRWSVLHEAISAIEPHLAEVEAAFDYDFSSKNDPDTLEKSVCDQVLAICSLVTLSDTEGAVSWTEIRDMIDEELNRREDWRSDENQKLIKGLAKPAAVKGRRLEPPAEKCPSCSGRGHLPMQLKRGPDGKPKTCPDCKGTGEIQIEDRLAFPLGGKSATVKAGDILRDSHGHEVRVLPANTDSDSIEPIFNE